MIERLTEKEFRNTFGWSITKMKGFDISPAKAFMPYEKKDVFDFGKYFHSLILEPHTINEKYIINDTGLNKNTKAYKEWKVNHLDKIIIDYSDKEKAEAMMNNFYLAIKEQGLYDIFFLSEKEVCCKWERLNLPCKGAIDILNEKDSFMADIKTIVDIKDISKNVNNYQYYRQEEFYKYPFDNKIYFVFIFCETKAPYHCRVVDLDPMYTNIGKKENEKTLEKIKKWNGNKNDLGNTVEYIPCPNWLIKK